MGGRVAAMFAVLPAVMRLRGHDVSTAPSFSSPSSSPSNVARHHSSPHCQETDAGYSISSSSPSSSLPAVVKTKAVIAIAIPSNHTPFRAVTASERDLATRAREHATSTAAIATSAFRPPWSITGQAASPSLSPRAPLQNAPRTAKIDEARRKINLFFSGAGLPPSPPNPSSPVSHCPIPYTHAVPMTSPCSCMRRPSGSSTLSRHHHRRVVKLCIAAMRLSPSPSKSGAC